MPPRPRKISTHDIQKKALDMLAFDPKDHLKNLEERLAQNLQKQLGPTQNNQEDSTDPSISLFTEKKNSRFLSLKDDY